MARRSFTGPDQTQVFKFTKLPNYPITKFFSLHLLLCLVTVTRNDLVFDVLAFFVFHL
jgi:hypothetical protein